MEFILGVLVIVVILDVYIRFRAIQKAFEKTSESLLISLDLSKKLFNLLKLQNLIIGHAMVMADTLSKRSLGTVQREAVAALKQEIGDAEFEKLREDIIQLGIDADDI
ncbi:MAG: hypothetical protein UY04_C0002G0018 [Parcubacteria group bacterium GW2011_GWA2_47_7]|nr:MAG: hypothetical protein UY04_C0002G0018 [Parcubacteria group bacterium GW2011_GWA2_47_7]